MTAEAGAPAAPLLSRWRGALVVLGLFVLALAIYLPYALKAGWYYDDWSLYAGFKDAGSSWSSQFDQCTSTISAGRQLTCLYHVTEYHLLTDHRTAYHLVAIGFLVAMAGLLYAILRRCRMPWQWAALVSALLVVFPASDATRLWPTGAIGQYVIVLELLGVLLTLSALARPPGWKRTTLHVLSGLIFVVAMASYEIVVPLVALNVVFYWAAYRNRAALLRGAVDLALAVIFVAYRLVVNPADPSQGFTVHRPLSGDLSRARALIGGAWRTWHETFLPGPVGVIAVIALIAIAVFLALRDPRMRRRLAPWGFLLAAGVLVAGASSFVFFTANDLYVPQLFTVFNRVTLPAAIPYICVFVALLGLGYEVLRRFGAPTLLAAAAVAVAVLASGWHQLRLSTEHKRSWEASWKLQETALVAYDEAARDLPEHTRVIGFGVPMWEPGFIPIFAASWDLRGALDYTTRLNPPFASPLTPTSFCGHRGMVIDGTLLAPYRAAKEEPLYFLNGSSGEALRVENQPACRAAIGRWGRPIYVL